MPENRQIKKKLYELSDMFRQHMRKGQYVQAKDCYDRARGIFVKALENRKIDEKAGIEIFGERGERGEILAEGFFPEREVIRAYENVIFKKGQAREDIEPLHGCSA